MTREVRYCANCGIHEAPWYENKYCRICRNRIQEARNKHVERKDARDSSIILGVLGLIFIVYLFYEFSGR